MISLVRMVRDLVSVMSEVEAQGRTDERSRSSHVPQTGKPLNQCRGFRHNGVDAIKYESALLLCVFVDDSSKASANILQ